VERVEHLQAAAAEEGVIGMKSKSSWRSRTVVIALLALLAALAVSMASPAASRASVATQSQPAR